MSKNYDESKSITNIHEYNAAEAGIGPDYVQTEEDRQFAEYQRNERIEADRRYLEQHGTTKRKW